ncbi:type IV pilus modification PilV family protein [Bacillus rubiinfantis]|uniref:type IV pilus modification PilV family protein n=1 Tax=Bacillus rubiinfantis TaxID=1499680 RepID=UPI0005AAED97|nr:prepilin-type N-terminal cleavage/methylation domain-containing protein [Bacillus rubiinfantis]
MKLRKLLFSANGLTLIEVLLSLTILSIVILGVMQFFNQAYSFTNSNQNKTVAINVARNAMMFMEKQSFIEMRKDFDEHSSEEGSLFICNNKYQLTWGDTSVPTGCSPISINNINYHVTILPASNEDSESYMLPLNVKVEWKVNNKQYSTELEGAIKSEDIR